MQVITNTLDPYAAILRDFVYQQFPQRCLADNDQLMELIFAEIIGSKQTRVGPKPSPEVLVQMRDVIARNIAAQRPIPMLMAWGSEKPDRSGVDLAELGAFKTLSCLQHRVSAHYSPGLDIRIRVEDASAPYLFHHRKDEARQDAFKYTSDLLLLAQMLESSVMLVPESDMVSSEAEFEEKADVVKPLIKSFIRNRDAASMASLKSLGWSGDLPEEQVEFYLTTYRKLYPGGGSDDVHHETLARYFASAWARFQLQMTGKAENWDLGFIKAGFHAAVPVKGMQGGLTLRTLPLHFTSEHLPPWRAKGYMVINEEDEACPKLASFNRLPEDLVEFRMTLRNSASSLTLRADYRVE